MNEIKCTIIQDVLPLYIDEVVSQDTKEMVKEHLQHCNKCQQEYDLMKQDLYLPVEKPSPLFNNISKKFRKKKVMVSIVSVLVTLFITVVAFSYVFHYERVIPYSKNLIKIEMQNDNQLISHYYGKSYAGVNETHPMPLEIDGKKKNVSFIFYTKQLLTRLQETLLIMKKILMNKIISLTLPKVKKLMLCIMQILM